jgi:hypothetical protein
MRHRSSYLAAITALLVVASVLIWLGGERVVSARSMQLDRSILSLVPAQATTIFAADINALRATPVYAAWQQHSANHKHDAEYDQFLAQTGFDIERDVQAVTAAAWKNGEQPEFLAIVTAQYAAAAVAAFLKDKGVGVETYNGIELLLPASKHQKPGADYPVVALEIPGRPNTILAGSSSAVKQALDLRGQPAFSVLSNQVLLNRVAQIGAGNQIWAVSLAPGAFLPPHLPPLPLANLSGILQNLRGSTFAVNAVGGLLLQAEGNCASDADAQMLADAGRGMLALIRLMAPPGRPEAIELLNSVQIIQQGANVDLTAQISPQLLDQLAQKPGLFFPEAHRQHR